MSGSSVLSHASEWSDQLSSAASASSHFQFHLTRIVLSSACVALVLVGGLIAVLVMISLVVGLIHRTNMQFNAEYELKKTA